MPLRQLYPDEKSSDHDAKVDIIAVHGLNTKKHDHAEHAWNTWRTPPGPEGRLWLRDDLPQYAPKSRIFLYEYKCTATFGSDLMAFMGTVNEFLEAVAAERKDDRERPIVFLGHGIGGMLVKQALINSRFHSAYSSIDTHTTGLVFFAIPRPCDNPRPTGSGGLIAKIAAKAGFRRQCETDDALKTEYILSNMNEIFWKNLYPLYKIVSFWGSSDEEPSRWRLLPELANGYMHEVELNANYSTICRFGTSQTDRDNLRLVLSNVENIYNKAVETGEFRAAYKKNFDMDAKTLKDE